MEISGTSNKLPEGAQGASPAIKQDFETFLKMLTTQIQNQDPLAPVSADDFANQLASFSMVEQQTLTNKRLSELIGGINSTFSLSRAGMLGQTVAHAKPFQFFGSPVSFEWNAQDISESANLNILDAEARLVAEFPVAQGQATFAWDGTKADGTIVNPGVFSAELVTAADGSPIKSDVTTTAVVEEVDLSPGANALLLSDGTRIALSDVLRIRQ